MPKDMGYGGQNGTDYGGSFKSTPSSNAGASGRTYTEGKFPRNSKQKDSKSGSAQAPYRNTVKPGDPGNMGY